MATRYLNLFKSSQELYTAGAPVVIEAYALHKDQATGKVVAQLKLKNISAKRIVAATVTLYTSDPAGRPAGDPAVFQYLDLNAARDEEFGQKVLIELTDASIRAMEPVVTEVVFADRTLWNSEVSPWSPLPARREAKTLFREPELLKQYEIVCGKDARYLLTEAEDLWFCPCGAVNRREEAYCHSCRRGYASSASLDRNKLQADCAARLEEEKRRREAEAEKEAALRQERAAEAAQRRQKTGSVFLRMLAALLVLCSALLIFTSPWLGVKGLSDEEKAAFGDAVTDEIEEDRHMLNIAKRLDRAKFEEAGIPLTDESVNALAEKLTDLTAFVGKGAVGPTDLLRLAVFAGRSLKDADTLYEMEETEQLFRSIGAEDFYPDICEQYELFRPYAPALCGFVGLLALCLLFALLGAILALCGKGRGWIVLYLILDLILAGAFAAAAILGNGALPGSDLPEGMRLALCAAPVVSVLLPIGALIALGRTKKNAAEAAPQES